MNQSSSVREGPHSVSRALTADSGLLTLEIFEDGVPPHWRVRSERGPLPEAVALSVETQRSDGARQCPSSDDLRQAAGLRNGGTGPPGLRS